MTIQYEVGVLIIYELLSLHYQSFCIQTHLLCIMHIIQVQVHLLNAVVSAIYESLDCHSKLKFH